MDIRFSCNHCMGSLVCSKKKAFQHIIDSEEIVTKGPSTLVASVRCSSYISHNSTIASYSTSTTRVSTSLDYFLNAPNCKKCVYRKHCLVVKEKQTQVCKRLVELMDGDVVFSCVCYVEEGNLYG